MLALSLLLLVGGHLTPFWVIVTLVRGAVKASKVTFNCTEHTAVWSRPHFNIYGREKCIPQGRRLLLDFLDVADPAVLAGVGRPLNRMCHRLRAAFDGREYGEDRVRMNAARQVKQHIQQTTCAR